MKTITVIITEGFSDWEIATLAGVGASFYGADIQYASPAGGAVTSAGGLTVADTAPIEPAPVDTVLAVCGSAVFEGASQPDLSAVLRAAYDGGCVVAGICGGTIALAAAGLLDDVRHTSNGPGYLQQHAPRYTGQEHYLDTPAAVRDGRIITAPAPAPATFASEVLQAAGLPEDQAQQIPQMLAAEHQGK